MNAWPKCSGACPALNPQPTPAALAFHMKLRARRARARLALPAPDLGAEYNLFGLFCQESHAREKVKFRPCNIERAQELRLEAISVDGLELVQALGSFM